MFCPNCGKEAISRETSFCSRCGFLLTGTSDLLNTGGLIPKPKPQATSKFVSRRSRGIRQGVFIFLLSFLVLPLLVVFSITVNLRSPALVIVAAIFLVIGGLLRMAYAMMFEDADMTSSDVTDDLQVGAQATVALPGGQSIAASLFAAPQAGNWRDTNALQPASVIEGTTRLLDQDEV